LFSEIYLEESKSQENSSEDFEILQKDFTNLHLEKNVILHVVVILLRK